MILEIAGLLVFLAVAAFLLVPMYRSGGRQRRQAAWPRVQALIKGRRIRTSGNRLYREYFVQYEYAGAAQERWVGVPDATFHTESHEPGGISTHRAVEARMAKHPDGSKLEVMIHPDNPDEAYFADRELPARTLAYVATAIFAVFFLLFLYWAWLSVTSRMG
jgi:hypothetical protein